MVGEDAILTVCAVGISTAHERLLLTESRDRTCPIIGSLGTSTPLKQGTEVSIVSPLQYGATLRTRLVKIQAETVFY